MSKSRRRLATVLAAVALALVSGACIPQNATPNAPCTPNDGRPLDVYLFGDSLSAWATHTPAKAGPDGGFTGICERFSTETGAGLSLNAMGGTRVDHHYPTFPNIEAGTCVIVALGTNDLTNLTLAEARVNALLGLDMLRDAGARRVVWTLLDENSAAHRGAAQLAETQGYNAFLSTLVAEGTYGDLLELADWRAATTGHDDYLIGTREKPADWVHHTDGGADAYSAFHLNTYREHCS